MSRSQRKHPCFSLSCSGFNRGEKKDKQIAHKHWRRNANEICNALCGEIDEDMLDDVLFPLQRELSDIWGFAKDGKYKCWVLWTSVKSLTGEILEWRMRMAEFLRK